MEKPRLLRKLLEHAVPAIAAKRDLLDIWIEEGSVAASLGGSLSFEQRYTLSVLVKDFPGQPSELFVPILAFIAEYQPELMAQPGSEPFRYEIELLTSDLVDVDIKIALTERVRVTDSVGGGWEFASLPEPKVQDGFEGACGATLWQLFLREQLIAQTTDPAFVPPAP